MSEPGQVCHGERVQLLAPIPVSRRSARFSLLFAGLALYGFSDGLLVLAGLGLDPWDVLHQGLGRTFGLQVGTWSILVGAVVLLGWIPLRQRPGIGTGCNVLGIGLAINATLAVVPAPHALPVRAGVLLAAVTLNGVATGAYIGAGLGPGPRDGLSTGIAARGHSLRLVRTTVELSVLVVGFLLGGTVGVGTLVYALTIGPITHITIPGLRLGGGSAAHSPTVPSTASRRRSACPAWRADSSIRWSSTQRRSQ
jgi:uncharacterized membrane protein YczE